MMIADARALLLKSGWLAAMPDEFRTALLSICERKRFDADDTVYLAGDPPGGIYGIALRI